MIYFTIVSILYAQTGKIVFFVRFNRVQGTRFGLYDFNESLEVQLPNLYFKYPY